MTGKISDEFIWLEIKPQQKFKDDHENQIFKIIQYASEFGFFILRNKYEMRLLVRTTNKDENLFGTIDGLAIERVTPPNFGRIVVKQLILKNHFMVPLFDQSNILKSDIYSKMWQEESSCMMACFVHDQTERISNTIHKKINSLENKISKKNVVYSSKVKTNLAGAKSKLGHNLYNCVITFGIENLPGSEKDNMETIIRLEKIIKNLLLNSFSHRIKTRRIRFISEKKNLLQKFVELLWIKSIDPYSFIPKRLNSKSLALSDIELAFFLSFPQEKDIQIIKFGIGATPPFVRSPRQELLDGNLSIQNDQTKNQINSKF